MLRNSTLQGSFPKEAIFQNLMMQGMAVSTPASCLIYSELSNVLSDAEEASAAIKGEIDFYLNGKLRWGVELLVQGREVGEHIERFSPQGKYYPLGVLDYAVVDFRSSVNGKTTQISHHPKRVTVFFDQEFTSCQYFFGYNDPVVLKLNH